MSAPTKQLPSLPRVLPPVLTLAQLAIFAGVSVDTIRKYRKAGRLPQTDLEKPVTVTGNPSACGGLMAVWRGPSVAEAVRIARELAARDWYDSHPFGAGKSGARLKSAQ